MDDWLRDIFTWLPTGGSYYALVWAIALFESLVGIGIFVPGSVLIVFSGFLAAHGQGAFLPLMLFSASGSFCGDLLSYWLGTRSGLSLARHPLLRKRKQLFYRAETFFLAHGGKSVFIARFVGFFRPFIPFIAGCSRMRPLPFTLFALVSCLLWGLAYPGLGYVFGTSWQMVKFWTGRFSMLLALLVLLFLANLVFWKVLFPHLCRGGTWIWERIRRLWRQLLDRPAVRNWREQHPRTWAFLAERFSLRCGSGLYLTTGFLVSTLFMLLFALLARSIRLESLFTRLDQRIHLLTPLVHHPQADLVVAFITHLGSPLSIALLSALLALWLLLHNRDFSAAMVATGMGSGALLVFAAKAIFARPRPSPYFTSFDLATSSFPSAHAFFGLLLFGLAAYMLLGRAREWTSRLALILCCSFLALLIGLSRVYLGVHWFSDVLGGFALAALWLTFLCTATEMRRRYGGEFPWRQGLRPIDLRPWTRRTILALALAGVVTAIIAQALHRLPPSLQAAGPEPPRTLQALPDSLEELRPPLPLHTENLQGEPLRPINLVAVARRDDLLQVLDKAGWRRADPLGPGTFLRSALELARGTPRLEGPVLPSFVGGHPQDLGLVRSAPAAGPRARYVLRLWPQGYRLEDGRSLWVGTVSFYPEIRTLLGIPLPAPFLAPALDRAREELRETLSAAGEISLLKLLPLSDPTRGRDLQGNPFHTDGRALFLLIGPAP